MFHMRDAAAINSVSWKCVSKARYALIKEAQQKIHPNDIGMQAYKCRCCRLYHLGHSKYSGNSATKRRLKYRRHAPMHAPMQVPMQVPMRGKKGNGEFVST